MIIVIILFTVVIAGCGLIHTSSKIPSEERTLLQTYAQLPLRFEANIGQGTDRVTYLSRGPGYTLFISPIETILSLSANSISQEAINNKSRKPQIVRMQLKEANANSTLQGVKQLPGYVNYLIGRDKTKWRTHIPTYAEVQAREVYPGIDIRYYGSQRQLEYDFIVQPGARVNDIRMTFSGVENLQLDKEGNLILNTPNGVLKHKRPVIYQLINGERIAIKGTYKLRQDKILKEQGNLHVGFLVAAYNPEHQLIIDPIIDYSTYLGGKKQEQGLSIAVDNEGNIYVTGETKSKHNFPTPDALQSENAGQEDVFISKLSADGTTLLYSTYLGGKKGDVGKDIAVDGDGHAVIIGDTESNDFPLHKVYQIHNTEQCDSNDDHDDCDNDNDNGKTDAFITKLSIDGSALIFSTYFGGDKDDEGEGIAIDVLGDIYITGKTESKPRENFPLLNAIQTDLAGKDDAYVAKFTSDGNTLLFSTYLGGDKDEESKAISLDSFGDIYITGKTESKNDFPLVNPAQANHGGKDDAFVAKLSSDGSTLLYATYLGGDKDDGAEGIAVDDDDNAYITGTTESKHNFPIVNALQSQHGGKNDAFITKLSTDGSTFLYSTYLGGNKDEGGEDIAVDRNGNAYVIGTTESKNDFPLFDPAQATHAGKDDAFVININSDGSALIYSTYLGGSKDEDGEGIAIDSVGNAYAVGTTKSKHDFPLESALQPFFGGQQDVFLAKVGDVPVNTPPIITSTPVTSGIVNIPYNYDVDADGDILNYHLAVAPSRMVIDSTTGIISWTPSEPGEFSVIVLVDDGHEGTATQSYTLTIEPSPNQAPQITSTPITEGHVSSFYVYAITAKDIDQDILSYTLNTAPEGMVIAATAGLLSWSEPLVGSHQISIQVNDGQGGTDTQDYNLTIADGPVITSTPATLTFANARYTYDVSAFDPNHLVLNYQLDTPPTGITIDAATGEIDWTPTTGGDFNISITVENEQAAQTTQNFVLTVLGDNDLRIVSEPQTEAYVGASYTDTVSVIAKQTDNLNYALLNPPAGMSISATGQLEWTPQNSGDVQVQVTVTNNQGGHDTQTFTVEVKTLEEMDAMFNEIWRKMFQDLIAGNKETALERFSSEVINQYEAILEVLLPFMNEIAANYTNLERITIDAETADYITRRVEDGGVDIFFITFVKDKDGNWKLYSM